MNLKNLFILLLTLLASQVFAVPTYIGDISRNDTLDIVNPCPLGGKATSIILGQINSKEKHISLQTSESCVPSTELWFYKEHWIRLDAQYSYQLEIYDSTLIINVYDASQYDVSEPCSGILKIQKNGNSFILPQGDLPAYVVVVVAGAEGQSYEIATNEVVYEYDEICLFDCIDKNNVLNNIIPVFPVIDVALPFLKQISDTLFENDCFEIARIERTQKVSSFESSSSEFVYSEYLFKNPLLGNIAFPKDVSLECGELVLEPEDLFNNLRSNLSDSLAYGFTFPSINGVPIIDFDLCQVSISYQDEIINGCEVYVSVIGVNRLWTITNNCTNISIQHTQKISRKYQRPILPIIEDQTIYTSPFDCNGRISIPVLHENMACSLDFDLKILNSGVSCQRDGDVFICSFSIGQHSVQYFIRDCYGFTTDTASFNLKVVYVYPPFIGTFYGTVTLNSDTIVIGENVLTNIIENNIDDLCRATKIEYNDLQLSCDTLDDRQLTICCQDLISEDGSHLLERIIEVVDIKVWTDDNNDGLFQLPEDAYLTTVGTIKLKDNILNIICPKDTVLSCLIGDLNPEIISIGFLQSQCFDHPLLSVFDESRDTVGNDVIIIRKVSEKAVDPSYTCLQKIVLEGCISSTFETLDKSFLFTLSKPNPFSESTELEIDAAVNEKIMVQVFNMMGQQIFDRTIIGVDGKNSVLITHADLKIPGTYICRVSIGQKNSSQKLIFFGN